MYNREYQNNLKQTDVAPPTGKDGYIPITIQIKYKYTRNIKYLTQFS